jgi:hypothetical protein
MESKNFFSKIAQILLILCLMIWATQAEAELKIDSVYPTMGIQGKDLPITINGSGFDAKTRVSMYLDTSNRTAILGSVKTAGNAIAVAVSGSVAYVADSMSDLQLIDVSDPSKAKIIGSVKTRGYAKDITVSGSVAYIKDSEPGLQVMDISEPSSPKLIGILNISGFYALSGLTAYISGDTGLQVMDISEPSAPKLIGAVATPGGSGPVSVSGSDVCVAGNLFQVINISTPSSPVIVGAAAILPNADAVAASGARAYVWYKSGTLLMLNLSDPYNPIIVGDLSTKLDVRFFINEGFASAAIVSDSTAYLAHGSAGVQVVDVSNPIAPMITGSVKTPGYARRVVTSGSIAYVADDFAGLQIIDMSKISIPNNVSMLKIAGNTDGIAISGSTAYVSSGDAGLQVIDVSSPYAPKLLGAVTTEGYVNSVAIKDSIAYVTDRNGLQIIDVSKPENPKIISSITTPGANAIGVAVTNSTAYVAESENLQIIDVSKPSEPKIIGTLKTPGKCESVAVSGSMAYIASRVNGLYVADVSKSSTPKLVATVKTPSPAIDVAVSNSIAYVADFDAGLQIIDVSKPSEPKIIGNLKTPGYAIRVKISGKTVYISDYDGGLHTIDVSDPLKPTLIGTIGLFTYNAAIIGNNAIISKYSDGLAIAPLPVEIKSVSLANDTTLSVTLPSVQIPGNYTIRVINGTEGKELQGAVTFVPSEESYLLDTKAIIVVGTITNDNIRQNTAKAGEQAYKSLLYQGYTAESIYYLAQDTDAEGVDAKATLDNISYAINTWGMKNPAATELLIYLVDHGQTEKFHINESEALSAQDLAQWLNHLQDSRDIPITLIYDACKSGSFVAKLSPPPLGKERIVITSTSPTEEAIISTNLSFSFSFWSAINRGYELRDAFFYARNQIPPNQTPLLDANGNGKGNEPEDESIAKTRKIRRGYKPQTDVPYIFDVSAPQIIHNETSVTLRAGVSYFKGGSAIQRVWAIISPPGFLPDFPNTPITNLPSIELSDPDNDGIYEGVYDNFTKNGIYSITICATNTHGDYALFRRTTVTKASSYISAVSSAATLPAVNPVSLLWASLQPGIAIKRVWAEIVPPTADAATVTLDLSDPEHDGIYQSPYDKFIASGTYLIRFYATDADNYTTPPIQTTVTKSGVAEGDASEPDNTFDNSKIVSVGQIIQHNFSELGDSDAVKFFAKSGNIYTIVTKNPSPACDTLIEIYKLVNGTPVLLITSVNNTGAGQEESFDWLCPKDGIYHVKIRNATPGVFGNNVMYDLQIYQPFAGVTGIIRGTITDTSGKPVADAEISTSGGSSDLSRENGAFSIQQPGGTYTLIVRADGYELYEISITIGENEVITENIILTPIKIYKGDVNGDGSIDLADVIAALRTVSGINQPVRTEADVNEDGKIGAEEAVYVLQKAAGVR